MLLIEYMNVYKMENPKNSMLLIVQQFYRIVPFSMSSLSKSSAKREVYGLVKFVC